MSKLWAKLTGYIINRTFAGLDKSGNRYFTRIEEIDGIVKEKRWVVFKGEQEPTSVPVEWICWLNGQRKKAPTPEEMADLEARREQVKLNVAILKEEEEKERKAKEAIKRTLGKGTGPDLKSFIQQFPNASKGTVKFVL
ncbi:NADH dehydrogenase [ubiquinone] 1 alpha subcomplex assembly factor 2 [Impatiens glandulifera]|uniref:NADH dehydrogenase [ubiquinone] 1 alpha subcomplex assembly factor 2 n=1 Tax=Impatiens glandulifera TaxID=253017 RepID=UPI001FB0B754|nr:NADH dehydrogenase [ubiquinone] 1 alpha subcomplex assembly factor 2 [Impatiens glandulifera]